VHELGSRFCDKKIGGKEDFIKDGQLGYFQKTQLGRTCNVFT